LLTLMFGHATLGQPNPDYYTLMYLGIAAVLSFGVQFTLAIRNVRRPEIHRAAMLLATLPILPPGINRLYMSVWHLERVPLLPTYLTMDAMAAAVLIHSWRTTKSISRVPLVCAGLLLLQQVLHAPIAGSDGFARLCKVLTDLVYYR
jgi:drug/metabolite transporter (DMT)-like permease